MQIQRHLSRAQIQYVIRKDDSKGSVCTVFLNEAVGAATTNYFQEWLICLMNHLVYKMLENSVKMPLAVPKNQR